MVSETTLLFLHQSLIILIFTILIKITNRLLNNITRVKDIFSILSYTLVPNIFALVILFPLELIFFGEYLFSNNPSPFLIKEIAAYIMLVLEILMILWTYFFSIMGLFTLTKSIIYSVSWGTLYVFMIFLTQYFLSFYLFTF